MPARRFAACIAVFGVAAALLTTATARAAGERPRVEFAGFVDTSVVVPFESDPDVLYGLDQAELDVTARPVPGLTVRLDLNLFPAEAVSLDERLLEQGFAEYFFNGGDDGFFVTAGKWNAPVGVESIDPVDMFQFSHGLLFGFATPANLTGFRVGWTGHGATVMLWGTNDWDTPVASDSASVGGRIAYDFGAGTVGLSTTYGPFEASSGQERLMVDLDLALSFGAARVFVEGNFGRVDDQNSYGALVKASYPFTRALGATLRFDWLDQPFDGLDNRASVTGALLFSFNDNFFGVVEVRTDLKDFGEADTVGAAELTATF